MAPKHQRYTQGVDENQLSPNSFNPYAYVPIDPFKPSIAFSLRKLSAEEDTNLLEDDRPPIRQLRSQGPRAGAPRSQNRAYGWTQQASPAKPAWRTVPHRAKQMAAHPPPAHIPPEQDDRPIAKPRGMYGGLGRSPVRAARAYLPPVSQSGEESSLSPRSGSPPPSRFEEPLSHSPRSFRRTSRPSSYHTPLGHPYALPPVENHSTIPSPQPPSRQLAHIAQDLSSRSSHPSSSRSRRRPQDHLSHSPSRGRSRSRPSRLPPLPGGVSPNTTESILFDQDCSMLSFDPSHLMYGLPCHCCSNPSKLPSSSMPRQNSCLQINTSSQYQQAHASAPPPVSQPPTPQKQSQLRPPTVSVTDQSSSTTSMPQRKVRRYLNLELSPNNYVAAFLIDTLPRQIYLNLLFRLPYLYFSRVTRIFEEAEMSMPMIRQGIFEAARANARAKGASGFLGQSVQDRMLDGGLGIQLGPATDNVGYINLQTTWLAFVDALLKEWKTLNIISVLLLSAILTILQIESAASDPLTRYSALLSMICALISLVYGCIYIIRFGTMIKTYKGAAWAQEAQKQKAGIWWNIWVMLALPATWLAWSLILYVTTITAFIWRTSPFQSPVPSAIATASTAPQLLIPRLLITTVLSLGIIYFVLIASTLRHYGETMDRAWQERIWAWMQSVYDSETVEIEDIAITRRDLASWKPENRDRTKDVEREKESYKHRKMHLESTPSRDYTKPLPPPAPAPTLIRSPQSEVVAGPISERDPYDALSESNLKLHNLQNIDTLPNSNLTNHMAPSRQESGFNQFQHIHEGSNSEEVYQNDVLQVVRLPSITTAEPPKSALFKGGSLESGDQINGVVAVPVSPLPRLALETVLGTMDSNDDFRNPGETMAFNGDVPELSDETAHLKTHRRDSETLSTVPSTAANVVVTDINTTPEENPNSEHLKVVADDKNGNERNAACLSQSVALRNTEPPENYLENVG